MSRLQSALDDYLALRRSLGHDLADAARLLPGFVAYLDGIGSSTVTVEAALAWCTQPEAPAGSTVWPRRMTAVRGFARYLSGLDPATQVPPVGLLPHRKRWKPPFLFSPGDIDAVLAQAAAMHPPLRAATYATLIGLLAVTGMRIGEALRLDLPDVDLADGVIRIRESKFMKSRLVPLHPTTTTALAGCLDLRATMRPRPDTAAVFVSRTRQRVIYAVVQSTFRDLCDRAGVGTGADPRPRLHGLRHSFAVATLLDWYAAGDDVDARIAELSTYLGHRDPRHTYWYLSAAPALLAAAADRLDHPSAPPAGRR